jgi:hypothetical protein
MSTVSKAKSRSLRACSRTTTTSSHREQPSFVNIRTTARIHAVPMPTEIERMRIPGAPDEPPQTWTATGARRGTQSHRKSMRLFFLFKIPSFGGGKSVRGSGIRCVCEEDEAFRRQILAWPLPGPVPSEASQVVSDNDVAASRADSNHRIVGCRCLRSASTYRQSVVTAGPQPWREHGRLGVSLVRCSRGAPRLRRRALRQLPPAVHGGNDGEHEGAGANLRANAF